jgi:hypothetical protein
LTTTLVPPKRKKKKSQSSPYKNSAHTKKSESWPYKATIRALFVSQKKKTLAPKRGGTE